jgi:catechol 2,3-dioxygenase-like lactoylglutathione lyase family enzyme
MSIQYHSSVLLTTDVRRLLAFYVRILGQEVQQDFGACVILRCGLSLWQPSDDLTVAVKLGYAHHPAGNKNLELCFETMTLDTDAERIKASGAKLLHDLVEEPWGQQVLRFFDPDGNLVELGESIPTFVRRHYASGLSAQAVAEKTGVPPDTVLEFVEGQSFS